MFCITIQEKKVIPLWRDGENDKWVVVVVIAKLENIKYVLRT